MSIDKKINYAMQGHKKPARNYLGKQKTVKNIPIKWKSGPKAPATELAYITKAEKDLILKKDLHGSLKHGPNTGPDGIMSLDTQGDYTRDRSPDAYGGPGTDKQSRDIAEQNMKNILTGQIDKGQTAKVSKRTRRGAVPEYVKVKQPDGSYKDKYVGSSIKGKRGLFSRLFNLSNVHTKGIKFKPGVGWVSEDERVGDIKPGWGGRILGGLASLATGIPFVGGAIGGAIDYGKGIFGRKPRDMSEFNKLSLTKPEDQKVYIPEGSDMPMARIDRWTNPINNTQILPQKKPINKFTNNVAPFSGYTGTQATIPEDAPTGIDESALNYLDQRGISFNKDGGRIGYQNGELVTDESMMAATPTGMMEENVEEVQGEPTREELEALAMEIFQLPLEELNEEQLMVVYQAAMQQEPMQEDIQQEDIQYAAQGGLAGLL